MSRPDLIAALVLAVAMSLTNAPAAWGSPSAECLNAIRNTAHSTGVPHSILLALAVTESGRQGISGPEPWPWALNQGGESRWFNSRSEALSWLDTAIASGISNIDIGCFQLNWHWHGQAFRSSSAMIDPETNARYAADFLIQLRERTGSWEKAVAGYHSFTPDLAEKYMKRFRPIHAAIESGEYATDADGQTSAPPRQNNYPLLQTGVAQSAGSLVTVSGSLMPLFGSPLRSAP